MSTKVRLKDLLREKDAFLTTSERIYNFYLTHTRKVLLGGLGLVLVALGVAAGFAIASSRTDKASSEYYLAYDSANPDKTLASMTAVREKWGDGKAGRLAAFAMVDSYIALGRFDEARELADALVADLKEPERKLAPILYNLQGSLAEQAGDLDSALSHYDRAWQAVEAPLIGPGGRVVTDPVFYQASGAFRLEILNSRARVLLALGRDQEARQAYSELELRFPGTPRAYLAGYRIYEIDAASGAPPDRSGDTRDPAEPETAGTVASEELLPAGSAPSAGDAETTDGDAAASAGDAETTDGDAETTAGDAAPSDGDVAPSDGDAAASDGDVEATDGDAAGSDAVAADSGDSRPAAASTSGRSGRSGGSR
ncbi:MAG: hypothetical protein LBR80_07115 [Deltaproteobacteria bacterium]|jgi:tetratricopeptide (TPR) repeat protein|nr:hypothetical protein [Deltaproteobacteria bacterium]